MKKQHYRYIKKRRRFNFGLMFAIIAIIGGIASGGFTIKSYIVNKQIQNYNQNMENIKKEKEMLEKSIPELTAKVKESEKEIEHLKDLVSYMQPVVTTDGVK